MGTDATEGGGARWIFGGGDAAGAAGHPYVDDGAQTMDEWAEMEIYVLEGDAD